MNKTFKIAVSVFLATITLFASCKKEKSTPKLLLSKVFRDGQLEQEYIYGTDKKVIRKNRYNVSQGQSTLATFRLYNYNSDGLLTDITDFTASSQFSDKISILYDVNKRVSRFNQRKSDNSIKFYYVFEYEPGGNLSKYSLFNPNDEKNSDAQFTYNADGFLSKMTRRSFVNGDPEKLDSTNFSVAKKLPEHWNYYEMSLLFSTNFSDRIFLDMITDNSFYVRFDGLAQKVNRIYAGKIYNAEGYLVKQTLTTTVIQIGSNTVTDAELDYEYIE